MISLERVRAREEFAAERARFTRLMADLALMCDQDFRSMPGRPTWLDVARLRETNRLLIAATDDHFSRKQPPNAAQERAMQIAADQSDDDLDVMQVMQQRLTARPVVVL